MGTTASSTATDDDKPRLLFIDIEGAPSKHIPIWDVAIVHATGSVRFCKWTTETQRVRLARSLPESLRKTVTDADGQWSSGTVHRIDQDVDLAVIAHAVADGTMENELKSFFGGPDNDAYVVSWSAFDTRTLENHVLGENDAEQARQAGKHIDALKCARRYFQVPSFTLASKRPGTIRHALNVRDWSKTPGCGGPHASLHDALVLRSVCRQAVQVLKTETDANMTMERFLDIGLGTGEQRSPHNRIKLPSDPQRKTRMRTVPSDVDQVFDACQKQMDAAQRAWQFAHTQIQYWDGHRLHKDTSREFKNNVRAIMGTAWCTQHGHKLNATMTRDGILKLLARAAKVI